MSETDYDALRDVEMHDIDEQPWGMLNALLEDRTK
jgi:hypothetical protein